MSLNLLQSALRGTVQNNLNKSQMSFDAFAQTEQERGNRIHRYRRYYDGDHDAGLTNEMRQLLRVSSIGRRVSSDSNEYDPNSAPFNVNLMPMIVDTKVDRLELIRIEADNDAAAEWANDQLRRNRADQLQLQIAESTSRDGDTFLFVDFEDGAEFCNWVHEPAYDGISGMVVLYPSTYAKNPTIAIKIWHITSEGGQTADTMRVNTYTNDAIHRYISDGGDQLSPYTEDGIDYIQPNPLGIIPVVHFRNNSTRYDNYGRSDIDDSIPLQDALNRTMVSMVATSELTAFPVRYGIGGFTFPSKVTPGMFLNLTGGQPASNDEKIEAGEFAAGGIVPFISQGEWIIDQIYAVSKTPKPGGGANESGEAKKQNEAALLGRIKRAQISYGASWEQVLEMAWIVETQYGKRPPAYESFNAQWAKGEIRNDKEILENAALLMAANPTFPIKEYYKIVAPVFGWDDKKIKELTEGNDTEAQARVARLGSIGDPFGALAPPQLEANNNNGDLN